MFKSDCQKVFSKMIRNPFTDPVFRKVNSDFIFPSAISDDSSNAFKVGLASYKQFVRKRFVVGCEDIICTPIKHHNLKLPKDASDVIVKSPRIKFSSSSITKIRDACSFRRREVKESFKTEITNVPECLTKDGMPYHSTKSKILDVVSSVVNPQRELLRGAGFVVDLSVVIRAKIETMNSGSTYFDLASTVLKDIEKDAYRNLSSRIDIVSDRYYPLSIKSPTRNYRYKPNSGQRIMFSKDDIMPSNFTEVFMSNSDNKMDLNNFIADMTRCSSAWSWKNPFFITYNDKVISPSGQECEKSLYTCVGQLEEADNRIMCHIRDMVQQGISCVIVRTADSDIVVILISFMKQFLDINKELTLFVDFASGHSRRYISINSAYENLGNMFSAGFSFFHAFTE